MTVEEADKTCKELTDLNLKIWFADRSSKEGLRKMFKAKFKSLLDAGFRIRKWRKDGTPMFTAKVFHPDAIAIVDNRPAGSTLKNDCTTRCISLCTGVEYDAIKAEQLKNARESEKPWATWKHDIVWSKSLTSRGFVKISLDRRHVSRSTFLKLASSLPVHDGKIATLSSGHVAAVDMASRKVLDTWNSTGGRIKCIYVPASQKEVYYSWLKRVGCCI